MPDIDDWAAPWPRSGACPARCGLSEVTFVALRPLIPSAPATRGPSKPMRITGGVHRPAATYGASTLWKYLRWSCWNLGRYQRPPGPFLGCRTRCARSADGTCEAGGARSRPIV